MLCASSGRWTFEFEAGPLGIAPEGGLYFQVSPFWGWSTPQADAPGRPGFTTLEGLGEDAALEARTIDRQLLLVRFPGRGMRPGERLRLTYGAGPAGARSDTNAERDSRFWFAVDGDGDGIRQLLDEAPAVEVLPREVTRLVTHLPSSAAPGQTVRGRVALLDAFANAVREDVGELTITAEGASCRIASELRRAGGTATFELELLEPGIVDVTARLRLEDGRELEANANPLLAQSEPVRVLWGDLHGHSGLSDGTGTPDDYLTYARDFGGLDFVALTDHDHYGMRALDRHEELWQGILAATARHNEPGRFLALPGYEWTSWIFGHRHVVYFATQGPLLSSLDDATDHPSELWDALRGLPAITIPHHPAGGPIAIDWRHVGPAAVEPVVELTSAHGSSEAASAPSRIYGWRGPGVRDVVAGGRRLGFIASGDSHDGHPGLTHLAPQYGYEADATGATRRVGNGGLVALFADELEPGALLEALRARRAYATNGPRILLGLRWGEASMGELAPRAELRGVPLSLRVLGTDAIARVELVTNDGIEVLPIGSAATREDPRELLVALTPESLEGLDFLYFRVQQEDGGTAWTSPVFFE